MFRRVLLVTGGVSLAWIAGFAWFIAHLSTAAPSPAQADGVVVVTGGGGDRISTAMGLMHEGWAQRLLISGVNPKTTRAQMAAVWPGERDAFDCCVDLGRSARTTLGNAVETRQWAADHDFQHIILVTSDYHMPRALLELRAAMPHYEITAHPVASIYVDENGRPTSAKAWRLIAFEYMKYLTVRVKTLLF